MNSRIVTGSVSHTRFEPKEHRFDYRVYAYVLDLDELEVLDRELRLFGYNRVRLASIFDRDYLEDGPGSIKTKLLELLAEKKVAGIEDAQRILLATSARYLNYVFNPVSVYGVYDRGGGLICNVAEVNNTFGDKHVYVLDAQENPGEYPARFSADKEFHVSPFFDLTGEYRFRIADLRNELNVEIELHGQGGKKFEAALTGEGKGRPLSDRAMAGVLLRHPATAGLTYPRIVKEAAKLYFGKRLGVHARPKPVAPMTLRVRKDRPSLLRRLADRAARSAVTGYLKGLRKGRLEMTMPDGTSRTFGGQEPGGRASLRVKDARFFRTVALGGDVGLGLAYTEGLWDSRDLEELFTLFLRNERTDGLHWTVQGPMRLVREVRYWFRRLRPQDRVAKSRDDISAHYDLSNDMFSLFLDPTMTYSCALFDDPEHPALTLEQAQKNKLRTVLDKAGVGPGDHVLEIGCGWGSFAVEAAEHLGCNVTGLTISRNQFEYARDLVRRRGLQDKVSILFKDFRHMQGSFDAVVSIEMLEAVDHHQHHVFFQSVDRLLKPGALAVLQVITIRDQLYDKYRKSEEWIQRVIFPGGMLPSLTRLCRMVRDHSRLNVIDLESLGDHYVTTLGLWRDRFRGNRAQLEALGFDAHFQRTWEYYLSMCRAGFACGHINDVQLVLQRPRCSSGDGPS